MRRALPVVLVLAACNVAPNPGDPGSPKQDLRVDGDLFVTGAKHFVADNPVNKDQVIVYTALEGGETGTYARGKVLLGHGRAHVVLPHHFSLVTSNDELTVQLTPTSKCQGHMAVESLTTEYLDIVEVGERSECEVFYLVQGERKGFENYEPVRKKGSVPKK